MRAWIGPAAVACLVGAILAVAASASADEGLTASAARVSGTVLGGRTSQGWPVVVELSKTGHQVVRVDAGLHLACTSGDVVDLPDAYTKLTVSRSGKFGFSYGPQTQRNQDGTTTDWAATVTGKLNKTRTKTSGTWELKSTYFDSTGAVTDTCNSGTVNWSAKA
jgi:hypothetical protein